MPNRTVLVTGAESGIGASTVDLLAARGFRTFAGVKTQERARDFAHHGPGEAVPLVIDVTDHSSIVHAVHELRRVSDSNGLWALVNNAGVALGGPLELLPIQAFRQQLEVNVVGPLALIQHCLPLLRQGPGRIVNVSSISGRLAVPFAGAYAASKFALEALSDALRRELRPWSIHVSIIEPGATATPIWRKAIDRATRLADAVPADLKVLYTPAISAAMREALASGDHGQPPAAVARAILRAVAARRPRPRYLVGSDAHVKSLIITLLTTRLVDRLIHRSLRRFLAPHDSLPSC